MKSKPSELPPGWHWTDFAECLAIGSHVWLNEGEGPRATITGITIRDVGRIQYEVVWWDGNQRHCQWVNLPEIRLDEKQPLLRIGFKHGLHG